MCQSLSTNDAYDAWRTCAFGLSGLLVLGPVSHGILSTATKAFPGSGTGTILRRVLAIQLAEPLRIGLFLPTPLLMMGASTERARDKIETDLLPTVVRSWCVFTAPLCFGFVYLRPENRIPLL